MEDWLSVVEKPSRYFGNELNAVRKDHAAVDVTIALAYPDLYEVGMSNTGLHILYHLLNDQAAIACERVYVPGRDYQELLEESGGPLRSLETETPIADFDVFGIQIPHELSYANIVKLIRLARLPIYAAARRPSDPIVIGGGPGAFAPEPVAPFYDAILLGDGEEALLSVLEAVRRGRAEGLARRAIVEDLLGAIEGVYVPSLFDVRYRRGGGPLTAIAPRRAGASVVRKALVKDLEAAYYPDTAIVPYTEIVHDRVGVEVMRGCTVGCRFCQAGMIYRPLRERLPETILKKAENALCRSGFDSVSLLSLDTGDYTLIDPLTQELLEKTLPKKVALSLPSLRAGSLTDETIGEIRKVRKTNFTIAPEAGTQRLRDVINKNISNEEIFETVERVVRQGWSSIKFYFMIGFPTETDADLEGIVDLTLRCRQLARRFVKGFNITVSFGTLVPKPHTPFQWDEQISVAEAERRSRLLSRRLRDCKIPYRRFDSESSWLEGVFSRGDRRLAPAIAAAERLGAGFDSWSEHLAIDLWRRVFKEHGIDADSYLRRREYDEVLPWDHLDCMVSKPYLLADRKKVDRAATTFDCRDDLCAGCSTCFDEAADVRNRLAKYARDPFGDGRALPMALTERVAGGHDFGRKLEAPTRDQAAKAGDDAAAAILRRRRRPPDPSPRRWAVTPGAPGQEGPADAFEAARIRDEDRPSASREAAPARAPSEPPVDPGRAPAAPQSWRYRLRYARRGRLRFLGHLEVVRLFYRALQRSELPIAYSQGYHPRPKVVFGPPLFLGAESDWEGLDIHLLEPVSPPLILERLRDLVPREAGLELASCRPIASRAASLQIEESSQEWECDLSSLFRVAMAPEEARAALDGFLGRERCVVEQPRGKRTRSVDVRALVSRATLEGLRLRFELDTEGVSAKPSEVVAAVFGLEVAMARTARYIKRRPGRPWPIAV